jgi:rhodanese-related sulfurtransferase
VSRRFDGVDELLADARSRLTRVSAQAAYDEVAGQTALIVDIRPSEQRSRFGAIDPALGPLVIDRNVLEWRLDPTSPHRLSIGVDAGARYVVVCNEGYASSLAAATLRELGLRRATDLVGGFQQWLTDLQPAQPVSTGRDASATHSDQLPG